MKKQLFSLVMMLAIVVLAGTSAWAQGLNPGDPYQAAVGSRLQFHIDLGTGNTVEWTVGSVLNTADIGVALTSTDDNNVKIVHGLAYTTADTSFTSGDEANEDVYVWFKRVPPANSVWVVQAEEATGDGCSTIRRYYVDLFNFDVMIQTADASGTPLLNDNTDVMCNSWDGNVVNNNNTVAIVQNMNRDSINNATDDEFKVTSTYFLVTFTIEGSRTTDQLKWRMFFADTTGSADDNVYLITSLGTVSDGNVAFSGEVGTGNDSLVAASNADIDWSTANTSWDANNAIYFGPTTTTGLSASWLIEVQTHNLLGQPDQVYNMKAMMVQVDTPLGTNYNKGLKVAWDSTEGTPLDPSSQSGTMTVRQTPATTIITVTE